MGNLTIEICFRLGCRACGISELLHFQGPRLPYVFAENRPGPHTAVVPVAFRHVPSGTGRILPQRGLFGYRLPCQCPSCGGSLNTEQLPSTR